MYCCAIPYEGEEPFVFFSYCHKDASIVYPIIERLASSGFRVWYDTGIHPGADWPEIIADHINRSTVCIAAITPFSLESHNCRRELTFAIERRITLIPIIMEDFAMSLGVRMELSSTQQVKKYEIPSEEKFFAKLFSAEGLKNCRGDRSYTDHDLAKQLAAEKAERERERAARKIELEKLVDSFGPEDMSSGGAVPEEGVADQSDAPASEPENPLPEIVPEKPELPEGPDEKTVVADDDEDDPTVRDDDPTVRQRDPKKKRSVFEEPVKIQTAILIHIQDRKLYIIENSITRIGRSSRCSIVLKDPTISSVHAEIVWNMQRFHLRDADSVNGTQLDGVEIESLKPIPLASSARITLAGHEFLFASGEFAEWLLKNRMIGVLQCRETDEEQLLMDSPFVVGRSNKWAGGALSDKRASRLHGVIQRAEDAFQFAANEKDEVTNGTYLNGEPIGIGAVMDLSDNDVIRIGHVYHLVFRVLPICEEEKR